MSMPKGMLVVAHGEAYEQHMVTVKAHHMFWVRQFQQFELELELIQTQLAQKPMLRAEVGMRVRCANKASAE